MIKMAFLNHPPLQPIVTQMIFASIAIRLPTFGITLCEQPSCVRRLTRATATKSLVVWMVLVLEEFGFFLLRLGILFSQIEYVFDRFRLATMVRLCLEQQRIVLHVFEMDQLTKAKLGVGLLINQRILRTCPFLAYRAKIAGRGGPHMILSRRSFYDCYI